MPLVNVKCTNCGAPLQVEDNLDAAICNYCDSAFVVEKAIHNYNINNTIHAGIVNIMGQDKNFIINGGVLTKYTGEEINVVIPNNVIAIGKEAFQDMQYIESIQIPNSVKEIESCAFQNCRNLKNITLPNSIKEIHGCAFQNCKSLKKITLPDSVTNINHGLFWGCESLESVDMPQQLYVKIPLNMFSGCGNLIFQKEKFYVTEIIECGAFSGTNIDSLVYFNNLKEIEMFAFKNCKKLEKLIISNSVTKVERCAFQNCSNLKEVTILCNPAFLEISVFDNCKQVEKVICPDSNYSLSHLKNWFDYSCPYVQNINDKIDKGICIYCNHKLTTMNYFSSFFDTNGKKCKNCGKYN